MLDALILAGSQLEKKLNNTQNKALLNINGTMMIEYVIHALKQVSILDKIAVVGPKTQLQTSLGNKVDILIDSNGDILNNLTMGLKGLGPKQHLLVCTSDIPLITPQAIDDFITQSMEQDVDICYPIVDKTTNLKKFPGVERTYVTLRDGTFTGGNVFLVKPQMIEQHSAALGQFFNARKNPLNMAKLLGMGFALRFLAGKLSISDVECKGYQLFGIRGKAIQSSYPEIGNDIDKESDIRILSTYLCKNRSL